MWSAFLSFQIDYNMKNFVNFALFVTKLKSENLVISEIRYFNSSESARSREDVRRSGDIPLDDVHTSSSQTI